MVLVEDNHYRCIGDGESSRLFLLSWFECTARLIEESTLYRIIFPIYIVRILDIHSCSEVHEGIVDGTDCAFSLTCNFYIFSEFFLYLFFFSLVQLHISSAIGVAGEDFFEIGIPGEMGFSISEGKYCCGRISSYPWEFLKELFLHWEYSLVFLTHYLGGTEDIPRS